MPFGGCGCVVRMLGYFSLERSHRGLPISLGFPDQSENEMVGANLRILRDRLASALGCFRELLPLQFDEGQVDERVGVATVDLDGAPEVVLGHRGITQLVVGESQVVVRSPEIQVPFEDIEMERNGPLRLICAQQGVGEIVAHGEVVRRRLRAARVEKNVVGPLRLLDQRERGEQQGHAAGKRCRHNHPESERACVGERGEGAG